MSIIRCLIVDDEILLRTLIVRAFSNTGFICEQAKDGYVAINMAEETSYDFIVSDLFMPNMDGKQLIVELLTLPTRPIVYVVTGVATDDEEKELLELGAESVERKPIDLAKFVEKIEMRFTNGRIEK